MTSSHSTTANLVKQLQTGTYINNLTPLHGEQKVLIDEVSCSGHFIPGTFENIWDYGTPIPELSRPFSGWSSAAYFGQKIAYVLPDNRVVFMSFSSDMRAIYANIFNSTKRDVFDYVGIHSTSPSRVNFTYLMGYQLFLFIATSAPQPRLKLCDFRQANKDKTPTREANLPSNLYTFCQYNNGVAFLRRSSSHKNDGEIVCYDNKLQQTKSVELTTHFSSEGLSNTPADTLRCSNQLLQTGSSELCYLETDQHIRIIDLENPTEKKYIPLSSPANQLTQFNRPDSTPVIVAWQKSLLKDTHREIISFYHTTPYKVGYAAKNPTDDLVDEENNPSRLYSTIHIADPVTGETQTYEVAKFRITALAISDRSEVLVGFGNGVVRIIPYHVLREYWPAHRRNTVNHMKSVRLPNETINIVEEYITGGQTYWNKANNNAVRLYRFFASSSTSITQPALEKTCDFSPTV